MATNTVYITAGLLVAKDSGQSPGAGENTVFVTAGLPKVVEAGAPAGYGAKSVLYTLPAFGGRMRYGPARPVVFPAGSPS